MSECRYKYRLCHLPRWSMEYIWRYELCSPSLGGFYSPSQSRAGSRSNAGVRLCKSSALFYWTGSSYSTNFHDITRGDNLFYQAGSSYDNATGLGSFIGSGLFASLTNQLPPPPPQLSPLLNITMTPSAPFRRGRTGSYVIGVSNSGNGPTSGPVTVAITLPKGLTLQSLSGSGWTFNKKTLSCTQTKTLKAGSSYSSIVLNVNVSSNAPNSVSTSAIVSGGGSPSSSITNKSTVR